MLLINKNSNEIVSENLQVANTFLKRLKGLMFTKNMPSKNALQISKCNAIHTFFMNYSIDVLYLDINNTIISIDENLRQGVIGKRVKNAVSVIELPNGKVKKSGLKIGDLVAIILLNN